MVHKDKLLQALEEEGFDLEISEIKKDFWDYSGYPKAVKKLQLSFKGENYSVEEMYFWMLGHATNDHSVPYVHKITDVFAASQGSSMFGDLNSRMTALQNQASQLLATTSNMTKDLFKRVRELRQIRERIEYYVKADADKPLSERKKDASIGAEATLKDIWINLVEGGGENPSSVYGLARKVGFVILPDLFLQAPPMKREEIRKYCDDLDFNPAVKTALERKLYQFLVWKNNTYKELDFKEKFQKKLIYQHYTNVQQYLHWIKPYLRNVKALSANENLMENHNIINAFQSSMVEIEVLLQRPTGVFDYFDKKETDPTKKIKKQRHNAVVLMNFIYQTEPSMDYHAKDSWQQKGPIHIGKVDATIRSYAWTDNQIDAYKRVKSEEDIDLIQAIDYTLKDEADLLGQDLKEVLEEVRRDLGKKLGKDEGDSDKEDSKDSKNKVESTNPFSALVSGLREITVDPFIGSPKDKKPKALSNKKMAELKAKEKSLAKAGAGTAKFIGWQTYKNYKKAHRMITW